MSFSLSDDVRQIARDAYGTVPNFLEAMTPHTGAPGAAYIAADEALMDGLLSFAKQQAVLLALAEHHNSRYDAVVHARLALDAGLPPKTVDHLLAGQLPSDERLRALIEATRLTCDERGWFDSETLRQLSAQGVSRGELYEIFALHGMKTFSSFVNHIFDPELDAPLKPLEGDLDHVPKEPSTMEMRRLVLG
jgi:alkylhydroperoxidase family enzyme